MSEVTKLKIDLHKIAGTISPSEPLSADAEKESLHDFVVWVGSQRNTSLLQMTLIAIELADHIEAAK